MLKTLKKIILFNICFYHKFWLIKSIIIRFKRLYKIIAPKNRVLSYKIYWNNVFGIYYK